MFQNDLPPSRRLDGVPRYGKGRALSKTVFAHRLGSNEAPDGEDALGVLVRESAAQPNRYPDLRGETLCAALSARFGLTEDEIAVGAGSIVLLDQLIRAFCDPGDEVVSPWRSYEAYPILAAISGAALVRVRLDGDGKLDRERFKAAIGPRTRVALICNPNNPTGTALAEDEIDALISDLPGNLLVVLDEAYIDYAVSSARAVASPRERLSKHPNLAILRTFSKAWGLAGLRAGYCLANAPLIDAVRAVAPPFPLSGLAASVATSAVYRPELVEARILQNATERQRLTAGLRASGLPVFESRANFVWLPVGERAGELADHFAAASIAVRCFSEEGVRITTGHAEDTDAVLASAATWR